MLRIMCMDRTTFPKPYEISTDFDAKPKLPPNPILEAFENDKKKIAFFTTIVSIFM